ncbi:MAG: aconitate hydratase [bacterium]|nr:aconitate hydratase [bacterium]
MSKGTITQKILDTHITSGQKTTGSRIAIKIDQTLTQDATGTMAYLELEAMDIDRVETELSVSYVDHNTMQIGPENRNDHLYLQSLAASKGIHFSRPGNGICHQVHLERFGVPGKTLLGSDSHTPTNGGIGMLSIGAGGLDVALAMAGKSFKLSYPKIIGIKLTGKLSPWVAPKDIILKVLSILTTKGNVGCIVEYFGPGVKSLSVPERATVTNMGAELGVTTSIFPSDKNTKSFMESQNRGDLWKSLVQDDNVEYDRVIEIDLNSLEPLAACPSSPDNIKTIRELSGKKIDQVIIGSCTNSSYMDLALVAAVLKDKTINQNVSLSIAPGSRQVMEMLAADNKMETFIASGARIMESACGPCIGQGQSPADDTISLRTFNRNFAGRTGTKGDQAYLVSPAVAVVSALTGEITDPRDFNFEYPNIETPKSYNINDNMIIRPLDSDNASKVEIIRKPTLSSPPSNTEIPNTINGKVVIKVDNKITTDHIMPAGKHLKLRSNIPAYSKVVFECFTENGKPSFAQRAETLKKSGIHGIIVAKESYGQGSSREHAAICPMYLGIKAVIAVSIERIHMANLINFGIVPLIFKDSADYDKIGENDSIIINDIKAQLTPGKSIIAEIVKSDGNKVEIKLNNLLTEEDIDIIKIGGVLNQK